MLPEHWDLRFIDMNVAPLRDTDLLWADAVLTSTMIVQAPSLADVVARCNRLGIPIAADGPYPSASLERLAGVDHVFIGEAEGAIPSRFRRAIFTGLRAGELRALRVSYLDL